ncbi:MAG: methyltransferase domain-containing protein [Oscillospiraceae bacterium]|nr:methyltransferase domain-containing protein [Oscillospiraceae bacterium]
MIYEELKAGLYVCRSKVHSFGTDAFLLTGFCRYREKDLVCDLGTGCGIIPLLMQRHRPPKKIWAVDIQPDAIEQLRLGIEKSGGRNIEPICADLRNLPMLPAGQFDLVTCNPPYKAANSGIQSADAQRQTARHETAGDIRDICAAASRLLQYHGRFCLCCRPERLADVICAMRENHIEPKRLRMVSKTPESAPWLFLLEGRKSAKPFLQIEPALFVRSGGDMTAEAAQICHFGDKYL